MKPAPQKKLFSFISGFTIIELLVSMSIIVSILSVVVYNHQKFDSNLELTNVAYRVALAIRQAQVYGISVKQHTSIGGDTSFNVPYGVGFNSAVPSKTSFIFYGDSNSIPGFGSNPDVYDGPWTSCDGECIERILLGRGNSIKKFCIVESSGLSACFPDNPGTYNGVNSLSIVFKRPKPDARINLSNGVTIVNPPFSVTYTSALICLQSSEGKLKKVAVYSTGQISVEDVPPEDPCNDIAAVIN